ncbi:maleylpyruvate isomerase family mycothiol-dependent enzyme [Streptomyces sp. H27-D2]|uniref:maleylpyruvate isomerase family mycothiol-dependent enzyme n=1 Tax=Streptomyces sp. H27-D2 TaxID=3046304 RepID=UPI002DBF9F2F|nr:maleylpyruvate isomerase family mycothiol-dependent enzyme [Streptomyces sp. H27-D2]MEC4016202.1 maleylpyruvate isomerase family mycothiol-dependent enzyme [Streptomyces sp. H27-D2]
MDMPNDSGRASSPAAHRDAIAAETARFVELIKGADLATPVPSCPGWTLVDLVRHTGSVQRWFSVLLRQLVQEPPRSRDVELRLPMKEDGYADWLATSAAEAASAFAVTDPDAPMWAWGADQHARFWMRRMLFETLVHRADAELALGLRPVIDRDLAADGVDEFLVNLPFAASFAPKVADLRGNGESIRFRCTDTDGDWLVRLRPDGFGIDRNPTNAGPSAPADAAVHGAAADLLLLMYGRLDHGSAAFEVVGSEDLLTRWSADSEF